MIKSRKIQPVAGDALVRWHSVTDSTRLPHSVWRNLPCVASECAIWHIKKWFGLQAGRVSRFSSGSNLTDKSLKINMAENRQSFFCATRKADVQCEEGGLRIGKRQDHALNRPSISLHENTWNRFVYGKSGRWHGDKS